MPRERDHYLIDGYNVIGSWSEFKELQNNISEARDKLINILLEYGAFKQYDITVVFDALFTQNRAFEESINPYFTVVYTDNDETADSYIERYSYDLVHKGYEVYVVTSDAAEQSLILGLGAYRISSSEFNKIVNQTKQLLTNEILANNIHTRNIIHDRLDYDTISKLDKIRRER